MQLRPGATTLTPLQRTAWLRLLRTENIGPATFRQLLNRFGSAEAALDALPELLHRTGKPVRITTQGQAEDEIAAGRVAHEIQRMRMVGSDNHQGVFRV